MGKGAAVYPVLPRHEAPGKAYRQAIARARRDVILKALRRYGGNRMAAARWLGITLGNLHRLMDRLHVRNVVPPSKRPWLLSPRAKGVRGLWDYHVGQVWACYLKTFALPRAPIPDDDKAMILERLTDSVVDPETGKLRKADQFDLQRAIMQAHAYGNLKEAPLVAILSAERFPLWLAMKRGDANALPPLPPLHQPRQGDGQGAKVQRVPLQVPPLEPEPEIVMRSLYG